MLELKKSLSILLFMVLAACSNYDSSIKKGIRLSEQGKDKKSLDAYVKALSLATDSKQRKTVLQRAVDLCERKLKDYKCALNTYRELLALSTDDQERESYHFSMGNIYFTHLQDYENALIQYSEAAELCEDPMVCLESKIKISHSYFYKKEYLQAIHEIEDLNKNQKENDKIIDSTKFIQAAILHAQALMGLEKYAEASEPLSEAIKTFPEEATKLKVPIILAVTYRENRKLKEAIEVLKNFKNQTSDASSQVYAESQITKLEQRLELQPGGPTGRRVRR